MLKPLTKERLTTITELVISSDFPHQDGTQDLIEELLEAEQFWREAVKNADMAFVWPNTSGEMACPFCKALIQEESHQPDCPWLKAQE
jgi:hypothetical protein